MAGRFIDKLKSAARLEPAKKEIILDYGDDQLRRHVSGFCFWLDLITSSGLSVFTPASAGVFYCAAL